MTDFDRFKLYKAKQQVSFIRIWFSLFALLLIFAFSLRHQYNRIVNTKLALLKSKGKTALKAKQNANKKTKSKK